MWNVRAVSGRAIVLVGLLAASVAVFAADAPGTGAQSQDPSIVCPPPIPPFIQVPCFDLNDKNSTLPIDEDSKTRIDDTNAHLRDTLGGNWGLSTTVPSPGSIESLDIPANLSVTPGEGHLDISWTAVSGAASYDVQAQTAGSSAWLDVANVTGTSHRYSTSETIDYVRVRARNNSGVGNWTQVQRLPAADFLTTVQSAGGASASSSGGASIASGGSIASQLAAPASITVTRDNLSTLRKERLTVTWAAVSGADGYNLSCSGRSGWRWWECGSTDSGSTTTLTVDRGENGDLLYSASYMVAVRAVTSSPAQASDWTTSVDAHPARHPRNISVARAAGSISVSWTQPRHSTGYEIECATVENGVTGTYRACADVETATLGSGRRVTATLTAWTVGGTTYTVDDGKTYDLAVRTTNAWGNSPWQLAPLIHPNRTLTVSNAGVTTATLTIGGHTGTWYYKATTGPHTSCQSGVSMSSTNLTGLTANTSYTYSAYSDSTCATGNLLAKAAPFTTLSSVSNLSEASDGIGAEVKKDRSVAVAFTTGGSSGGYTLRSVTIDFHRASGGAEDLTVAIHAVSGSVPAETATYTLSGDDPSVAGHHTFTCSVACSLSADTTYFLVLSETASAGHFWDTTASPSQANSPSSFGWSIADEPYLGSGRNWTLDTGYVGQFSVAAALAPSLTSSSITATTATLTIADHHDAWYYKATSGPHTSCQGPVAAGTSSASLTRLSAASSYTYSAYSDSACSTLLATAAAFTTTLPAPTNLQLNLDGGVFKMRARWNKPSGVTGAVSYEVEHADSNRNNPYGYRTTIAATSASQVTHHFNNTLTVKFRVRAKVGSATSAWAEYVSP